MKNNNGLNIVQVFTVVFIILKLTKVISWSWIWVLSPVWITLGIGVVVYAIGYILEKMEY